MPDTNYFGPLLICSSPKEISDIYSESIHKEERRQFERLNACELDTFLNSKTQRCVGVEHLDQLP